MKIISPSKLNSFSNCPFAFKCHYINHYPKIKTPDAHLFGSMVHDIIPNYYDKMTEMSREEDSKLKIEEAFAEGTDWRLQKRKTALRKVQTEFQKFEANRIRKGMGLPTFTEKHFTAQLFEDSPDIEIIVDAYWPEGLLVDWKTGKYAEMTESLMIQGKTYEMVLTKKGYPVKKVKFVNLFRGITLDLPKLSDAWLHQRILDMMEKIEKEKYPTKRSPLCNGWCEYRLRCDLRDMEGFYEIP